MTLTNPTPSGNAVGNPTGSSCTVDTFKVVSGTSTAAATPPNPPTLCGVLDGSHSKAHVTRDIFAHNIAINRYFDI
jgi:hypothetical protein